jgi:endonuclease/exonuclease/phosphatase family metal-dependent hydrolase
VHAALARRLPIVVIAALCVAFPAATDAAKRKPAKLTVETRNLYLGGDIAEPIGSKTKAEFSQKNTDVWNTVRQTNFPARAKLLVKEIKQNKPDLVAMQEVALWRRTATGTHDVKPTIVVYDFLKSLQKELKKQHLSYAVGSKQNETTAQGPTDLGYDVQFTLRDVILVKRGKDVKIRKHSGKNYKTKLNVPTAAGPVTVKRGFTYVDLTYHGRKLRFVDTHLESFLDATRVAQSKELVGKGGPLRSKQDTILAGDMNSDRKGLGGNGPGAYDTISKAGFSDAWVKIKGKSNLGLTCCFTKTVNDPPSYKFNSHIDQIFYKNRHKGDIKGKRAKLIGHDPKNRTATGLWPSDHGSWVGVFSLK